MEQPSQPDSALRRYSARMSRGLLMVVILVAPWLYGGVFESTHVWVAAGLLLAFAMGIPELLGHGRLISSWSFLFLLAAVFWGVIQLAPLPEAAVTRLSPMTTKLRAELAPALQTTGHVVGAELENVRATLTLRPTATRHDLAWLVLGVLTFTLASVAFSQTRHAIRLCAFTGLNGACLATFGIVQKLTWNGQIFWVGMDPTHGRPFASYGNPNNAAGYLLLCLAGAVGYTTFVASPPRAKLSPRSVAWGSLTVCIAAGILSTLSRGGSLALVTAAIGTAIVMALAIKSRFSNTTWLLLAVTAGAGLMTWAGLLDPLVGRFQEMAAPRGLTDGRLSNWLDALHAVPDFPCFGSGLGTYRDIYLLYQHRYAPAWFYFAENQYLQALVEGGVVGLMLLLAVLAGVAGSCWRILRHAAKSVNQLGPAQLESAQYLSLGQAGTLAVMAQAAHAVVDFGLYLPANMLLMATFCGAVTGVARQLVSPRADGQRKSELRLQLPTVFGWLGIAALLPVGLLATGELYRNALVADAIQETYTSQTPTAATDETLAAAIERLEQLAAKRGDDAELHYELAKKHIQRYRLARFHELRSDSTADVGIDELWERTSMTSLHRSFFGSQRAESNNPSETSRANTLVAAHLEPAWRELLAARAACPILAKVHLRLARLSPLFESCEAADAKHLARACRVEPSFSYTRTRAGRLHAQAGRHAEACSDWRSILSTDPAQLDFVLIWGRRLLPPDEGIDSVIPDDPALLLEVAERHLLPEDGPAVRERLLARAERELEAAAWPPAERAYLTATLLRLQGRSEAAVEHFERAVQLAPQDVKRRFELATLLRREGRFQEASRHAAVCLGLRPDNKQYAAFRNELRKLQFPQK